MKTLFKNTGGGGEVTFHPTASLAKAEARNALLRGALPFAQIAEPVAVPTGARRDLARFLNSLISPR